MTGRKSLVFRETKKKKELRSRHVKLSFFLVKSGTLCEAKRTPTCGNLLRSKITGSIFLSMTVLGIDHCIDGG